MTHATRTISAGDGLTPVEAAILDLSRSMAVMHSLLEQNRHTLAALEVAVRSAASDLQALQAHVSEQALLDRLADAG